MSTTNVIRRHFRLISVGVIIPVILVFCGSAVLSSGLSGVGLLAFARYLQASPQATSTPTLLQAEHLLRQAVLWNPANTSARRGLGFVLAERGQEEAMTAWQAAGGMVDEFIQRGQQARGSKHYEEALAWYKWAAMVEPELGDPWYYSGLVHEKLEQWEQALKAYEQAVKAGALGHVGRSSLYYRLGLIYQQRMAPPQLDKALTAYETALELEDFSTNKEAADCHYQRGKAIRLASGAPSEYIAEYQRAIELNSRHITAHISLGLAYYTHYEDVEMAEDEILQAIELSPRNKRAYLHLGDIYRQEGQTTEAAAMYEQALEIDPDFELAQRRLQALGSGK